jgi:hypothetical protein
MPVAFYMDVHVPQAITDQLRRRNVDVLTPSDIPSWFRERETNREGQVTMTEYSSDWTDARMTAFQSLDQNSDGIITPTECLASPSEDSDRGSR